MMDSRDPTTAQQESVVHGEEENQGAGLDLDANAPEEIHDAGLDPDANAPPGALTLEEVRRVLVVFDEEECEYP